MFGGTLGIVSQGLEILRKSIDIRNRNILNANNPDYAQEDPVIKTFVPYGISLETIERVKSLHYVQQRNAQLSLVSSLDERIKNNTRVEDLFQEFTQGLGGIEYINTFFTSYQDLMKDPTNEGARAKLVQSANSLVGYLKDRKRNLDTISQSIDYSMRQYVDKVNSITKKLAKLNQEILITYAQTYARGQDYKNILDERDRLLRELSEYINIRVQEDDIGRVKVETSKGFVLVEDKFSWELAYDGANKRVLWKSKDGSQVDISGEISGGRLKGGLDAIADLQDYQNRLDQLVKKLISEVKLPAKTGITEYYWTLNYANSTDPLGTSGTITLNGSSSVIINYTSTDTLTDLANAINSAGVGFSAVVVANPDGTYTLQITSSNPSYTITDSSGMVGGRVFEGTGIADIRVAGNISTQLSNLDYSKADEFNQYSRLWWDNSKNIYQGLTNAIAGNLNSYKKQYDIENAVLNSLNAKLQEMQGVSIDKEFMEVFQLQRSYQALAKVVSAMDELIQTTLNMV
ncbi:MAG: flagellar hook-associated protein FlgK [Thermocrinis sp.]|jgi:flagellar hook-associated protein 1 FlgK|nr:flagellar hook-associated protein FlgK [Thermocrinis sp.]